MSLYSIGQRTTVTTSGNEAIDVANPTASSIRSRVMEFGIFLGAATASRYSLSRNTALGTRTTPSALQKEDPADQALTGITLVDSAVAFSVEPTKTTIRARTVGLPATIGVGIIWTFPRGYVLDVALSAGIVNEATNSAALDCHIVADA